MITSTMQTIAKRTTLSLSDPELRAILGSTAPSGQFECHFERCLEFLQLRGQIRFGARFSIQPADHEVIFRLLAWAVRDRQACIDTGMDWHRGILLLGPVGCGKTTLLTLIRDLMYPDQQFRILPCSEIVFDFCEHGYETIRRYSALSFRPRPHTDRPVHYCFDDLGTEPEGRHFAQPCNVMAEILTARYRYFHAYGMLTHLTTNLSADEIEARYGNRVRSRMREVFNLVSFATDAPDKRR